MRSHIDQHCFFLSFYYLVVIAKESVNIIIGRLILWMFLALSQSRIPLKPILVYANNCTFPGNYCKKSGQLQFCQGLYRVWSYKTF